MKLLRDVASLKNPYHRQTTYALPYRYKTIANRNKAENKIKQTHR